ncbi:MAG: DEAD/DEAH box helicase [Proteobacteria bacterium]|nr:DEAD/DEAH box helicase [Pseudomonadota bacterium]NIS71704.1 DEAD/DEAH box helicase [Pseudomonadota bacterium]
MPRPRLAPHLGALLRRIGVPFPSPFRPDPFQLEAREALRTGDVLVIAPTGSGKTWIAEEAIRGYLGQNKRSWYASPLKALSNSKYEEFSRIFGPENVGILTGDRKENPDARVIIGTTEILRNQLYDAMMEGRDIQMDLAILDEAHYLNDPDRGVVWEEVLIYMPNRVRILLLSATIGNGEEIGNWLEAVRSVKCHVVQHGKRPVPLHLLFLFPDGELCTLGTRKGIHPKIERFLASQRASKRTGSQVILRFGWLIDQLRRWDLLPAIFFLKSRADCDRAIQVIPARSLHRKDDSDFKEDLHTFLRQYSFLQDHRQLPYLKKSRVGSHHGGQLPHWKLLIEEMMKGGYLDAIFSTSTVAAGVNFPARTVVLVQSDRFDGRNFSNLTATELHQMTGRAGRRGKDRIGFALVLPGMYQDPMLIHQLIDSPPEPIRSQIQMSFSMVLNLLLSQRPSHIQELLDKSLAAFQDRQSYPALKKRWTRLIQELDRILPKGAVPDGDPIAFLKSLQVHAKLRNRIQTLKTKIAWEKREFLFSRHLKKGGLFVDRKGRVYVALHTFYRQNKLYCGAQKITGAIKIRKSQIRLRKIAADAIDHLLDHRVDIPEDVSRRALAAIFAAIPLDQLRPIEIPPEPPSVEKEELRKVEAQLAALSDIQQLQSQVGSNKKARVLMQSLERLALRIDELRHYLWNEFNRHLDFLRETGFVDKNDRLTDDGKWASCLRLDHPLLIAEGIRKGLFEGASPRILAGLIAPFVMDRTRDVEVQMSESGKLGELRQRFTEMVRGLNSLQQLKRRRAFETLQIQFWPAASLFFWSSGMAWDDLIRSIPIEEGDMAMLILRTADHLRQLLDLEKTHYQLAKEAREALPLILREPVLIS